MLNLVKSDSGTIPQIFPVFSMNMLAVARPLLLLADTDLKYIHVLRAYTAQTIFTA